MACLLGSGIYRALRVSARQVGHDAGIDDAQIFDAVDLETLVNDTA